ncbi:hypothetical protein BDM02DRAFT_3119855 [Thelephora ganbajun]|uniref:Uncharacterized protein n=1 Tax=Thelephora ganbajun TaxID=370292 RepID=A0ACB6Z842_THEGA|nr:hypothetical protein BDM02DRAFT_3119855 [Thelephora ganbajun]
MATVGLAGDDQEAGRNAREETRRREQQKCINIKCPHVFFSSLVNPLLFLSTALPSN